MVSTTPRGWQVSGYLDALRPEPDWTVDLAILSAYSADPVSIVAVLLALIGRDDEERTPSRRDLADAVEQLRDRTRIVLQQGRLATMRQPPRLTGVLDQFVREVAFDERRHSWHAKAALVRMTRGAEFEWRLWVGSRNLTTPENLDLGLLLVGGRGGRGRVLPGAQDIARALAERAELDGVTAKSLSAELDGVKWQAPDIVILDEFQRYRELIDADTTQNPLMAALLKGRSGPPPALLLLSATPYRLYASRWEESRGVHTITPRLSEIEEEIVALRAFRETPSGSIRLTLSDHALDTVVWPKLKPVLARYPDIRGYPSFEEATP